MNESTAPPNEFDAAPSENRASGGSPPCTLCGEPTPKDDLHPLCADLGDDLLCPACFAGDFVLECQACHSTFPPPDPDPAVNPFLRCPYCGAEGLGAGPMGAV